MPGSPVTGHPELQALERLGVPIPPMIWSLGARVEPSDRGGLALTGLFSRGKSRLFNDLVGQAIAEVGALPTTAVPMEAMSGPRLAVATWADHTEQLPPSALEAAQAVRRFTGAPPRFVELYDAFRLPPGLRLVDTPGVGAVAGRREVDWFHARAGAAALVLSFPPGPQREDWDLLAQLRDVFGSRVIVLLKATQSDVERDDLHKVRDTAQTHGGTDIELVPGVSPEGPWGSDAEWSSIEQRIEALAGDAGRAKAEDRRALERWIEQTWVGLSLSSVSPAAISEMRTLAFRESLPAVARLALDRLEADADRRSVEVAEEARREQEAALARRVEIARHEAVVGQRLTQEALGYNSLSDRDLEPLLLPLHDLIVRVDGWMATANEYGVLERDVRTAEPLAETLRIRYVMVSAGLLLAQVNALYQQPVGPGELPYWSKRRAELCGDVRAWLASWDPMRPESDVVRLRLWRWLEDTERDGEHWGTAATDAARAAVEETAERRARWALAVLGAGAVVVGSVFLVLLVSTWKTLGTLGMCTGGVLGLAAFSRWTTLNLPAAWKQYLALPPRPKQDPTSPW